MELSKLGVWGPVKGQLAGVWQHQGPDEEHGGPEISACPEPFPPGLSPFALRPLIDVSC